MHIYIYMAIHWNRVLGILRRCMVSMHMRVNVIPLYSVIIHTACAKRNTDIIYVATLSLHQAVWQTDTKALIVTRCPFIQTVSTVMFAADTCAASAIVLLELLGLYVCRGCPTLAGIQRGDR